MRPFDHFQAEGSADAMNGLRTLALQRRVDINDVAFDRLRGVASIVNDDRGFDFDAMGFAVIKIMVRCSA